MWPLTSNISVYLGFKYGIDQGWEMGLPFSSARPYVVCLALSVKLNGLPRRRAWNTALFPLAYFEGDPETWSFLIWEAFCRSINVGFSLHSAQFVHKPKMLSLLSLKLSRYSSHSLIFHLSLSQSIQAGTSIAAGMDWISHWWKWGMKLTIILSPRNHGASTSERR